MKKKNNFKSLMILMVIFSLFIFSTPLAIATEGHFEFTTDFRDSKLDFISKIKLLFKGAPTFTAAGEQRGCSDYPDSSRIIDGVFNEQCSVCEYTALIDVYKINSNGGWDYFFEIDAPAIIGNQDQSYGLECYCCPPLDDICDNGETKCATEESIFRCVNNDWVHEACPSGQKCNLQGVCSSICIPNWVTSSWSSCVNGKETRTCYDSRNCGTGSCPSSISLERDCEVTTTTTIPGPTTTTTIIQPISEDIEVTLVSVDKSQINLGDDIVVHATFKALKTGSYILESHIQSVDIFSVLQPMAAINININKCDPGSDKEWQFKNDEVILTQGRVIDIDFTFKPVHAGKFKAYVDVAKECGGEIILGNTFAGDFEVLNPGDLGVECKEPLYHENLKDSLFKPTELEIQNALCRKSSDCCDVEGYTVGCVREETFEKTYRIDLTKGVWLTYLDWWRADSGACVAKEKNGGFDFGWFTEDSILEGIQNWIIILGAVVGLGIISKMFGGKQ